MFDGVRSLLPPMPPLQGGLEDLLLPLYQVRPAPESPQLPGVQHPPRQPLQPLSPHPHPPQAHTPTPPKHPPQKPNTS